MLQILIKTKIHNFLIFCFNLQLLHSLKNRFLSSFAENFFVSLCHNASLLCVFETWPIVVVVVLAARAAVGCGFGVAVSAPYIGPRCFWLSDKTFNPSSTEKH